MERHHFAGRDDLHEIEAVDWQARTAIYAFIVATGRPPEVAELATTLRQPVERIALAYVRLHQRHAIFLQPDSLAIRMANPFSAIPTPFRVTAEGRQYWANCAWDMLGIPAALGADAIIEAHFATAPDDIVTLRVQGDQVDDHGEVVHFPLPFNAWYDDLIRT